MSAKKIFFGNYKGGVGKTTSTFNLAIRIAKTELENGRKAKVLVVDLDPQSSLSEVCLRHWKIKKRLDELGDETLNYVYDIYMQAQRLGNIKIRVDAKNIIKQVNDFSLIPNSLFYKNGGLDKFIMEMGDDAKYLFVLWEFMEENRLDEQYDYILFDCPPSNNIITQSAFLYSDYYVIPTIMDALSTNGVRHYISVVENLYKKYCMDEDKAENSDTAIFKLAFGDKPQLLGIFETMRTGTTNTDEHRTGLRADGYHVFETEIKDAKEVSDNIGEGAKSYDPHYDDLTQELLTRIEQMEAAKNA